MSPCLELPQLGKRVSLRDGTTRCNSYLHDATELNLNLEKRRSCHTGSPASPSLPFLSLLHLFPATLPSTPLYSHHFSLLPVSHLSYLPYFLLNLPPHSPRAALPRHPSSYPFLSSFLLSTPCIPLLSALPPFSPHPCHLHTRTPLTSLPFLDPRPIFPRPSFHFISLLPIVLRPQHRGLICLDANTTLYHLLVSFIFGSRPLSEYNTRDIFCAKWWRK